MMIKKLVIGGTLVAVVLYLIDRHQKRQRQLAALNLGSTAIAAIAGLNEPDKFEIRDGENTKSSNFRTYHGFCWICHRCWLCNLQAHRLLERLGNCHRMRNSTWRYRPRD